MKLLQLSNLQILLGVHFGDTLSKFAPKCRFVNSLRLCFSDFMSRSLVDCKKEADS